MKKYPRTIQFSLYTAIISFVTAVTIFTLYFFSGDLNYAFIGYFAMLLFGLLNVTALVILVVSMSKNSSIRRIGSRTILFQLFNIPVAIMCLWAGSCLTNIARITFVNETGAKLENVRITGCDEQVIKSLEPGESETVWIGIKSDCSVKMVYMEDDSTVNETVCGYLCHGMGMVYCYNIGGSNSEPEF